MAASSNLTVITTAGTGASAHVVLPKGEYACSVVWAGTPGDLDIQVGDGTTFADLLDAPNGSVVNVIANSSPCIVAGGMSYRVDVTTHTSVATVTFHRVT